MDYIVVYFMIHKIHGLAQQYAFPAQSILLIELAYETTILGFDIDRADCLSYISKYLYSLTSWSL